MKEGPDGLTPAAGCAFSAALKVETQKESRKKKLDQPTLISLLEGVFWLASKAKKKCLREKQVELQIYSSRPAVGLQVYSLLVVPPCRSTTGQFSLEDVSSKDVSAP